MRALLADEIGNGIGIQEKLVCRHETAGYARNEALRKDPNERIGKLYAYLILLPSGESVDDAVDGLGRIVRMERGKHEMSGLGRSHRSGNGLRRAHFADHDDIDIFSED